MPNGYSPPFGAVISRDRSFGTRPGVSGSRRRLKSFQSFRHVRGCARNWGMAGGGVFFNTLTMSPDTSRLMVYSEVSSRICTRSEEHTSELQSLRHLVCRLLLEK